METKDYYNESIYLDTNRNEEALKEIYYQRRCYWDRKDKNIREYSFLIQEYDNYLNFIICLIKELGIPLNAISFSVVLDILIKKGVFSNLGEFIFNKNSVNYLTGFLGINIVVGTGCCRHIAAFSSDVINRLNLMSDSFGCYITEKNLDNVCAIKGNHVINLIEYDGTLYGYDSVHSMLFRFVDSLKLESLYGDRKLYVYYKPYYDMIVNGINFDNVLNLITLFENFSNTKVISYSEYIDICRYAKDIVDRNRSLLRDFQGSSKKYVKRITDELK